MSKSHKQHKQKALRWRDRQKQDQVIDIEFVDAPKISAWGGWRWPSAWSAARSSGATAASCYPIAARTRAAIIPPQSWRR